MPCCYPYFITKMTQNLQHDLTHQIPSQPTTPQNLHHTPHTQHQHSVHYAHVHPYCFLFGGNSTKQAINTAKSIGEKVHSNFPTPNLFDIIPPTYLCKAIVHLLFQDEKRPRGISSRYFAVTFCFLRYSPIHLPVPPQTSQLIPSTTLSDYNTQQAVYTIILTTVYAHINHLYPIITLYHNTLQQQQLTSNSPFHNQFHHSRPHLPPQ